MASPALPIAIVGPTASGKSAAAMRLAEALGGEIICCDSMQIYRGMDIGTAKASTQERARVPHHVIDIVEPDDGFSAARYVEHADRAMRDCAQRNKRALIVGGTGLYLRALRFGLMDAPPRDDALRRRLLDEEGRRPGVLHLRLRSVDPESATRIEPADLVRVVRALEVHELTGITISAHHASQPKAPRHAMRVALLEPDGASLERAIVARAEKMISDGLLDETRRIRDRFGVELLALGAVGYKEACRALDGSLSLADLPIEIARATRQYARRQRTWFKKEPDAVRYDRWESLVAGESRV